MSVSLCVIVPSRGLAGLLASCLQALDGALEPLRGSYHCEVVVADNATNPPIDQSFLAKATKRIRYDRHRSFSGIVNDAASKHRDAHLLLLNNDVLLHPLSLLSMVKLLSQSRVGVVGTRLVYPDGTIQHAGVYLSVVGPAHVARGVASPQFPRTVTFPPAVTGATMLIRRETFEDVHGFDEGYDFGSEDIDFCHRARQRGWQVACAQEVDSLHFEATTEGRRELDIPARARYLARWFSSVPQSRPRSS